MLAQSPPLHAARPIKFPGSPTASLVRCRNVLTLAREEQPSNDLLAALSPEALREFRGALEPVQLSSKQVLFERHIPLRYAYFIERGAASVLSRTEPGRFAEVATLGHGDFVGVPLVLGLDCSPHRCVVQAPGHALRIGTDQLKQALDTVAQLRKLLLAYVHGRMVRGSQLAVCNTRHRLRERLARWLLVARDRFDSNEVPITHEALSRAIGVRRAGITTAIGRMEEAGILYRGRGRVVIRDHAALRDASCACYSVLTAE